MPSGYILKHPRRRNTIITPFPRISGLKPFVTCTGNILTIEVRQPLSKFKIKCIRAVPMRLTDKAY